METLTEIMLESKGIKSTLVRITESGWPLDESGVLKCMGQTEGWTHFLCCLKAYVEHGIDLRKGGVIA